MAFSLSGDKCVALPHVVLVADKVFVRIFSGYTNALRIFDLTRPGRDYQTIATNDKQFKLNGTAVRGMVETFPVECILTSFQVFYHVSVYAQQIPS